MITQSNNRFLIHGISIDLSLLSDLLFYDAMVCSDKYLTIINPFDNKLLDKLIENNLIVKRDELLSQNQLIEFDKKYPPFKESGSVIRTLKEQGEIDRNFSDIAFNNGILAVPKFNLTGFSQTFKIGNIKVLSIVFSKFPIINPFKINIHNFIDFLIDEETIEMRRRLFLWINEIKNKVEKNEIEISEISDIIEDNLSKYISWINVHTQEFKYKGILKSVFEIVTGITALSIISPKALTGIPIAVLKGLFTMKTREIELSKAKLQAPGREIAYIAHVQQKFSNSQ